MPVPSPGKGGGKEMQDNYGASGYFLETGGTNKRKLVETLKLTEVSASNKLESFRASQEVLDLLLLLLDLLYVCFCTIKCQKLRQARKGAASIGVFIVDIIKYGGFQRRLVVKDLNKRWKRVILNTSLILMPILDGQAVFYSFESIPKVRIGVAFGSRSSQLLLAKELPADFVSTSPDGILEVALAESYFSDFQNFSV
ncbi:hypothetical protein GIB67_013506 [Kingdonia uniflora]|uniref:Uncharacterized protein n=1 Tax=Kingdonia uniflora TaxID=39325 RepID=A0A7J7KUS1_9MAGN|nr:hypothetical protein GIB67_013506 [Kingdonia uniflora]